MRQQSPPLTRLSFFPRSHGRDNLALLHPQIEACSTPSSTPFSMASGCPPAFDAIFQPNQKLLAIETVSRLLSSDQPIASRSVRMCSSEKRAEPAPSLASRPASTYRAAVSRPAFRRL